MTYNPETVRALYRKLLTLYPRAFREQLGESMEQTFVDLCRERRRKSERWWPVFVLWIFIETALGIVSERITQLRKENMKRHLLADPGIAAVVSILLAFPLAFILSAGVFEIEPFNSWLKPLFTEPDGYRNSAVGLTILIGLFFLLPVAFIVSLIPVRRMVRAGQSLFTYPFNLVLAFVILVFITNIVGYIAADQFPCWIGVPNCD